MSNCNSCSHRMEFKYVDGILEQFCDSYTQMRFGKSCNNFLDIRNDGYDNSVVILNYPIARDKKDRFERLRILEIKE